MTFYSSVGGRTNDRKRPTILTMASQGASPQPDHWPALRPRLILASASPRRLALLNSVDVTPEVIPADVDESLLEAENAGAVVLRLAELKAKAVMARVMAEAEEASPPPSSASSSSLAKRVVVIAADTVISLDGEIFGKPVDNAEARTMLSRLSGRAHSVLTGVAIANDDQVVCDVSESVVWFRNLCAAEIDCYVATGEPVGKSGAYAIQGRGGLFVERVDGNYHGIVGLPMCLLDKLTSSIGYPLLTWANS